MAKFVPEFNGETKQQISGPAIGPKSAPVYVCIFMEQVESKFLNNLLLVLTNSILSLNIRMSLVEKMSGKFIPRGGKIGKQIVPVMQGRWIVYNLWCRTVSSLFKQKHFQEKVQN